MIDTGSIGILAITAPGAAICYEELVSYYGRLYGKYFILIYSYTISISMNTMYTYILILITPKSKNGIVILF